MEGLLAKVMLGNQPRLLIFCAEDHRELRRFGNRTHFFIDIDFVHSQSSCRESFCPFCDRTQASTSLILNFQVRPTFTPGIPRFSIHARVVSLVIPRNSAISFIEHQRSGSTNSIQLPLSRFWPPGMSTFQKLTLCDEWDHGALAECDLQLLENLLPTGCLWRERHSLNLRSDRSGEHSSSSESNQGPAR